MKQRLISCAVGLTLLAGVLVLYGTVLTNIVLAVIACLAIYEVCRAMGLANKKVLLIGTLAAAALTLILELPDLVFVYSELFLMFCVIMFAKDRHYTFKEGGAFSAASIMIVLGLGSLLKSRAMFAWTGDARFAIALGLATGWLCDTFAFCFGKLFGKKKMCPSISPNKTIAGGIGGVLGTPVAITIFYAVYASTASSSVLYGTLNFGTAAYFFAVGMFGAVIGIIGDLAASYIKRECGIKDFGNIMPGHGGAMDRIDSVLFTCTFTYLALVVFVTYLI